MRFVGVDCGFNVCGLAAMYHYHQEVVLCRAADAPATQSCTVAGHINEAGDLFAEDRRLPEIREGDILALLNVGGYAAAMASYHCARPPPRSWRSGDAAGRRRRRGVRASDRALDESGPAPLGSLVGAIGQMGAAVLVVVAIVALFVAVAVALRWVFWR